MPTLTPLPIEVWARIAYFLPPGERVRVFWALRSAMALPTHGGHALATLSLFLEDVVRAERAYAVEEAERAPWPSMPTVDDAALQWLISMGIDAAQATRLLFEAGGDVHLALDLNFGALDADA